MLPSGTIFGLFLGLTISLSTCCIHSHTTNQVLKEGNYLDRVMIDIPTVVKTNYGAMGGTDIMDQKISYNMTKIRARKWQTRIYFHFLNAMLVNAHILYKIEMNLKRGDKDFTSVELMLSDVKDWVTPQIPVQGARAGGKFEKAKVRVFQPGVHSPIFLPRTGDSWTVYRVQM